MFGYYYFGLRLRCPCPPQRQTIIKTTKRDKMNHMQTYVSQPQCNGTARQYNTHKHIYIHISIYNKQVRERFTKFISINHLNANVCYTILNDYLCVLV